MSQPVSLDQIARDAKWVSSSPDLLESATHAVLGEWNDAIPESESFRNFFADKPDSHRVGYYFEELVHYFLKEIRQVKIIHHGLQIQDGKRTVGELDFVFRDETGNINHWEVAVKFYLHSAVPIDSGSHFIGPNARDTLERKHKRFIEHQLPLGRKTIPEIDQQTIFVKGMIFYHPTDMEPVVSPLLSEDHAHGTWIRKSEIPSLERITPPVQFRILEKPCWLSGSNADLLDFKSLEAHLQNHFTDSVHPVFLSAVNQSGSEVERIFVVNNQWPEEV